MKSENCQLCGKRKAKRACPALGHVICAVCCGTKRLVEIACPADCRYLASSQLHPPAVLQRQRERDLRFIFPLIQGLTERQQRITLEIQQILWSDRPHAPNLTDEDVVHAVRALAETYETASRGIIYDHTAGIPSAERLGAELKTVIERIRTDGLKIGDADIAAALRRVEAGAREAQRVVGGGDTAYLQLLRRLFGQAADSGAPESDSSDSTAGPSLIVP